MSLSLKNLTKIILLSKHETKQKHKTLNKQEPSVKQATHHLTGSNGPANHDTVRPSCTRSPHRKCTRGCCLFRSPSGLAWKNTIIQQQSKEKKLHVSRFLLLQIYALCIYCTSLLVLLAVICALEFVFSSSMCSPSISLQISYGTALSYFSVDVPVICLVKI